MACRCPRSPDCSGEPSTPRRHCSCAHATRSAPHTKEVGSVPDPFDALRIGRNAVNPPDDFAGRLRGRLREELGMTTTTTTTTASGLRELYYATITVQDLERGLR